MIIASFSAQQESTRPFVSESRLRQIQTKGGTSPDRVSGTSRRTWSSIDHTAYRCACKARQSRSRQSCSPLASACGPRPAQTAPDDTKQTVSHPKSQNEQERKTKIKTKLTVAFFLLLRHFFLIFFWFSACPPPLHCRFHLEPHENVRGCGEIDLGHSIVEHVSKRLEFRKPALLKDREEEERGSSATFFVRTKRVSSGKPSGAGQCGAKSAICRR